MATQTLIPDDDGDLNEKMKIPLVKKASLERERELIEEQKKTLIASTDPYPKNNANQKSS